jgi:beta-phosphoglucomutase-like phosphatase (HAD superfamily)
MPGMTFQGIIFDFNGVLWWDEILQEQTWRMYAEKIRGVPLKEEELRNYCLGVPNKLSLEYLLGRNLSRDEINRLSEKKETYYRVLCVAQGENFHLSAGAAELLDWLVTHNIPRAIATSSPIENVNFFSEYLLLPRWFASDQILYDNGRRNGKPHPDIYQDAANALGLEPAKCVVVEDSLSGIQAARAAGIGCIFALGPPEQQTRLASLPGVHAVISSLTELPAPELFDPAQARQGS